MRPEVVESLFVLHHLTGNPVYRDWGWSIFQSMLRYCSAEFGFAQRADVSDPSKGFIAKQEHFVLAETFKYLYLLFTPAADLPLSLTTHVFSTGGHFFRLATDAV